MCFYHGDADWSASVCETTEGPAEARTKCDDCYRPVLPGQWRKHVYMQEHELCLRCEDDSDWNRFNYDPDNEECKAGKHDYGETFDCDSCEHCERLREAIQVVEEAEGCVGEETRPLLSALYEQISNGDGWQPYIDAYARLRPGEYIDWPHDDADYGDWLADEYDGYWCEKSGHQHDESMVVGGEA